MRNHLLTTEGMERFDLLLIQNIFILLFFPLYSFYRYIFLRTGIFLCFCSYSQNFFFGIAVDRNINCLLESKVLLSVYTLICTDTFNECVVIFAPG